MFKVFVLNLIQQYFFSSVQGLLSVGVASSNSTLPGKDHFDILEGLSDISYSLSRSVVDFITAHIIK